MDINSFNLHELESLERQQASFTYKDKGFILVEADGESVTKWRNEMMKGMKMGNNGQTVAVENLADNEAHLVSLCLFYADEKDGSLRLDADGNPDVRFRVPKQRIVKWPNRVQKRLYEVSRQVSGIDDDESLEALTKQRDTLDEKINVLKAKQSPSTTSKSGEDREDEELKN